MMAFPSAVRRDFRSAFDGRAVNRKFTMSMPASLPHGTSGMTAMELSVSEAATQAGVSKTTLLRAIRRGQISATRGEVYGTFTVDPSEVARVFRPRHTAQNAAGNGAAGATDPVEMRVHNASIE